MGEGGRHEVTKRTKLIILFVSLLSKCYVKITKFVPRGWSKGPCPGELPRYEKKKNRQITKFTNNGTLTLEQLSYIPSN